MTAHPVEYRRLEQQLVALCSGETDALANTANFVALLYDALPDINWLGVYVARNEELVLGPFQGKPACVRIPLGQGVCGTAAETRRALNVADVHSFAGHIACDPVSRSELVVPLVSGEALLGVLDIDSPLPNRFAVDDELGVSRLCTVFVERLLGHSAGAQQFL